MSIVTLDAQATAAQSAVVNAPANAQAAWAAANTQSANDARVAGGVTALSGLLANGYDQNSDADNQALIQTIAGGVSLIPGIGIVLGAAIEVLDAVGQAAGVILQKIGLIPTPGCSHTGPDWTTASVLSEYPPLSQLPGPFAQLAMATLATNAATQLNCGSAYPNSVVLQGMIEVWNAAHPNGAPISIVFPYPNEWGAPFARDVDWTHLFDSVSDLHNDYSAQAIGQMAYQEETAGGAFGPSDAAPTYGWVLATVNAENAVSAVVGRPAPPPPNPLTAAKLRGVRIAAAVAQPSSWPWLVGGLAALGAAGAGFWAWWRGRAAR